MRPSHPSRSISLLCLALAPLACAPADGGGEAGSMQEQDVAATQETLRGLVEEFDAAMNAEDLDALASQFVASPVSLPPDAPAAVGMEAFRELWGGLMESGDIEVDNRVDRIIVSGDLATGWGEYDLTVTGADGETMQESGHWMATWQRQADGSWKGVANMWNRDAPMMGGGA